VSRIWLDMTIRYDEFRPICHIWADTQTVNCHIYVVKPLSYLTIRRPVGILSLPGRNGTHLGGVSVCQDGSSSWIFTCEYYHCRPWTVSFFTCCGYAAVPTSGERYYLLICHLKMVPASSGMTGMTQAHNKHDAADPLGSVRTGRRLLFHVRRFQACGFRR